MAQALKYLILLMMGISSLSNAEGVKREDWLRTFEPLLVTNFCENSNSPFLMNYSGDDCIGDVKPLFHKCTHELADIEIPEYLKPGDGVKFGSIIGECIYAYYTSGEALEAFNFVQQRRLKTGEKISPEEEFKLYLSNLISTNALEFKIASEFFLKAPNTFRQRAVARYTNMMKEFSESVPHKIGEQTTVRRIQIEPDSVVLYYELKMDSLLNEQFSTGVLATRIANTAQSELCSNPESALYMLYGNSVIRKYYASNNAKLATVKTTWEHCVARPS